VKSLGVYSLHEAEQYFQRGLSLFGAKQDFTDDTGFIRLLADMSYVLVMILEPGRLVRLIERHRSRIDSLGDLPSIVIILTNYLFAIALNVSI
jgi:hypothetical protein